MASRIGIVLLVLRLTHAAVSGQFAWNCRRGFYVVPVVSLVHYVVARWNLVVASMCLICQTLLDHALVLFLFCLTLTQGFLVFSLHHCRHLLICGELVRVSYISIGRRYTLLVEAMDAPVVHYIDELRVLEVWRPLVVVLLLSSASYRYPHYYYQQHQHCCKEQPRCPQLEVRQIEFVSFFLSSFIFC